MTLTLENIPPDVHAALKKKAAELSKSIDQVAVEAIKTGLGLPLAKVRDLSDLAGTWIDDPAFDATMKEQDRIDPEMWR